MSEVLWAPPIDAAETTNIGHFAASIELTTGRRFDDYEALWRWSVDDIDGFWRALIDWYEIRLDPRPLQILSSAEMPSVAWLSGARMNYAEHALRLRPRDGVSVIAESQTRPPVELTWTELRDAVARARAGLQRLGVGRGDRVAAYLPNVPETVTAFLACASLGAIWASCAPEFGARAVLDRFGQIEPSVLLVVDGYRFGDRVIDLADNVSQIRAQLPTLRTTVLLQYGGGVVEHDITWDDLVAEPGELTFESVPADHPLYVLFSSGTTGLPKPIVHGHGGILLEHHKVLGLHGDLTSDDRFFWFTTTGWMMWNYLVSGLLHGSAIVLFDGDPASPSLDALWALAARTRTTWFGVSAPFLMACRKGGLAPRVDHDLSAVRAVGSTGAPLPAEGFRWVYEALGPDVFLSSISGGTDVCSAFVGGCPVVPVTAGEISCRYLGASVEAFADDGRALVGQAGELVVTRPMPSMPVGLWGDADGSRLRATYFDRFPGVWAHGDWITISEQGTCVISGRSDATLNRGGVRIGSSEIYRTVEEVSGVADSLIVHLESDDGGPGLLILFVQKSDDDEIEGLEREIRNALRSTLSPRHVPDEIHWVASVPTTKTGKKLELPVKRILRGADPGAVMSRDSLRDPLALDEIVAIASRR